MVPAQFTILSTLVGVSVPEIKHDPVDPFVYVKGGKAPAGGISGQFMVIFAGGLANTATGGGKMVNTCVCEIVLLQ